MKQTMKYLSMAALVVMGAILASCAKTEIEDLQEDTPEVVEPSAEDHIVVCTTTVSIDTDATKALTEDGVKTFAAGDMIAVIYKNTSSQTVKAVSSPLPAGDYGNSASFTVSLTNPADNAAVRIIYPAAMAAETVATGVAVDADATVNYAALNTQDGTLASLSSNLDLAVYDGNLSGTSLPADPALHNKLAICLYTLKNSDGSSEITGTITGMTISDGTYNYTVNRSAAAGPIYVAIRPTSGATINYTATNGTNYYKKTVTDKTYAASQMYPLGLKMAVYDGIDLSTLTGNCTAQHGDMLYGTLSGNYKISIADGATVTLNNATINGENSSSYRWAGLTCLGDATIILNGTNAVKGFYNQYPGIHVPSGKTLTIQGTGSLDASSNDIGSAGIGGGWSLSCGNIIINGGTITAGGGDVGIGSGRNGSVCGAISINGGTITATGSNGGAGIGSGQASNSSCGSITISGGTVTATGGKNAAGIGAGQSSSCGAITIENTVTRVTATKGSGAANSIGSGYGGSCGTVTIGGVTGAISTSPYTYEPGVPLTSSSVGYRVCSDGMAYATNKTLPSGVSVIGMVAYKSGSTGVVLYKEDKPSTYTWENRNSGNPDAVNVYVSDLSSTTSKSWTCGDRTQYENCGVTGSAGWSSLQTRLTNAGCNELVSGYPYYWTNTETSLAGTAWAFYDGYWDGANVSYSRHVRPLFAF